MGKWKIIANILEMVNSGWHTTWIPPSSTEECLNSGWCTTLYLKLLNSDNTFKVSEKVFHKGGQLCKKDFLYNNFKLAGVPWKICEGYLSLWIFFLLQTEIKTICKELGIDIINRSAISTKKKIGSGGFGAVELAELGECRLPGHW